jgi:hypothetical protein
MANLSVNSIITSAVKRILVSKTEKAILNGVEVLKDNTYDSGNTSWFMLLMSLIGFPFVMGTISAIILGIASLHWFIALILSTLTIVATYKIWNIKHVHGMSLQPVHYQDKRHKVGYRTEYELQIDKTILVPMPWKTRVIYVLVALSMSITSILCVVTIFGRLF